LITTCHQSSSPHHRFLFLFFYCVLGTFWATGLYIFRLTVAMPIDQVIFTFFIKFCLFFKLFKLSYILIRCPFGRVQVFSQYGDWSSSQSSNHHPLR
jgi:hypothetical protein